MEKYGLEYYIFLDIVVGYTLQTNTIERKQLTIHQMSTSNIKRIKRPSNNKRVERPKQTGFSSPATHYTEPRIDLNDVLVQNSSSTFYIRVIDDSFQKFNIFQGDVLIVDKSLFPKVGQLVLATYDNSFSVIRIEEKNNIEVNIWGVITYIIKSVL